MYSILFSEKSNYQINEFINSYKKIFLKRFIDTGIYNEKLIINNYISLSEELKNTIYMEINQKLKEENVLGRMISLNNSSLFLNIGNYKVLILYNEDISERIRIIEEINFYKK